MDTHKSSCTSPGLSPGPPDLSVRSGQLRVLPSGRSIVVTAQGGREAIEVRSAQGDLEVRVELTDQGPVLSIRGARLEIDSTDTVAVTCRQFELNAQDQLRLHAGGEVGLTTEGEIKMKSAQQTFIDGDYVNLNCLDRKGYHDDPDRTDALSQQDTGAKSLPERTPRDDDPALTQDRPPEPQ